jgi:putative membrane protein
MESFFKWVKKLSIPSEVGILAFFYASGIVAHIVPQLRVIAFSMTDLFLFGINAFLLKDIFDKNNGKRLLFWIIPVYLFTFSMEAVGVATGKIFGSYHYGSNMHLKVLGVPLVIAFNWLVLALAINSLSLRVFSNKWLLSIFSGVLIACYDYFIEPVAINLDYWKWESNVVPVQNYVAWCIIGFFVSYPLHAFKLKFQSPLLLPYLFIQWIYFNVLVLLNIKF